MLAMEHAPDQSWKQEPKCRVTDSQDWCHNTNINTYLILTLTPNPTLILILTLAPNPTLMLILTQTPNPILIPSLNLTLNPKLTLMQILTLIMIL